MIRKLNLGCGEFKKKGFVNVDYFSVSEPDIRHNLEMFPYPFVDNEFILVEADHVLEHLNNPFGVMKELHRIVENGGMVKLKVPHFSRGFTHPEHKRGFDLAFCHYFNPSFQGGYQGFEFVPEKITLAWMCQPYLKKTLVSPLVYFMAMSTGKILDFFANLAPLLCSRIWCYWVGGFEEIEFHFRVVKK
ncbi:MAG: methyltransferase domain-containing protein [Candidatus Moraniibacteriota bacterium]